MECQGSGGSGCRQATILVVVLVVGVSVVLVLVLVVGAWRGLTGHPPPP